MEVNTNYSAGGVVGFTPQTSSASATRTAAAPDAFASSNALAKAVKNLPASRPEAVAQARALVENPGYPSADTLGQVSLLLAGKLVSGGE
jgi:hypothetical protein